MNRYIVKSILMISYSCFGLGCSQAIDYPFATAVHDEAAVERDAMTDAMTDSPTSPEWCGQNERLCAEGCVNIRSSIEHCGDCAQRCEPVEHGVIQCIDGRCVGACEPGTEFVQGRCIARARAPQPIAPLSLGTTTHLRPTFRWKLSSNHSGASVELCRDRDCNQRIETLRVEGTSVRPTRLLPTRSVVFWRLRGLRNGVPDGDYSPTWLLHTPGQSARSGADTSNSPHLDLNGDGFDDLVIGSPFSEEDGLLAGGSVSVYYGGPGGPLPDPAVVLPGGVPWGMFGSIVGSAGDVNGDGFGDLFVASSLRYRFPIYANNSVKIFHGSATGVSTGPTTTLRVGANTECFGCTVSGAGDVNADGFADLLVGSDSSVNEQAGPAAHASLFLGNFQGIFPFAAATYYDPVQTTNIVRTLQGAVDFNADGKSDFVLCFGEVLPVAANARVFFGGERSNELESAIIGSPRTSTERRTNFATVGDVDADGYADLLAEVYNGDEALPIAPLRGELIFGGPAVGARTQSLPYHGDHFESGHRFHALGDVNGDGFDDVAFRRGVRAEPFPSDIVYIHYGAAQGLMSDPASVLSREQEDAPYFSAIAALGDVNNDGFADVAMGIPLGQYLEFTHVGRTRLYLGGVEGIARLPRYVWFGRQRGDLFGASVATGRLDWNHPFRS